MRRPAARRGRRRRGAGLPPVDAGLGRAAPTVPARRLPPLARPVRVDARIRAAACLLPRQRLAVAPGRHHLIRSARIPAWAIPLPQAIGHQATEDAGFLVIVQALFIDLLPPSREVVGVQARVDLLARGCPQLLFAVGGPEWAFRAAADPFLDLVADLAADILADLAARVHGRGAVFGAQGPRLGPLRLPDVLAVARESPDASADPVRPAVRVRPRCPVRGALDRDRSPVHRRWHPVVGGARREQDAQPSSLGAVDADSHDVLGARIGPGLAEPAGERVARLRERRDGVRAQVHVRPVRSVVPEDRVGPGEEGGAGAHHASRPNPASIPLTVPGACPRAARGRRRRPCS